jgi:CRP-like cAMP-binding protein
MSPLTSLPPTNKLLAALPKKDYEGLRRHLEEIPLVFGEVLYRPNTPISDVFFPNRGIISLLAGVNERSTLEVGFIGDDGMVGLGVFLGVNSSPNRAVVQGEGSALKMKATTFRRKSQSDATLAKLLNRYANSLLLQVTQYAVCNQFHTVDARLARWLLMTNDRMGDNEFQLTQEFMSNMLGVRREGVSVAAGNLQKRKLISYSRGRLQVLDRLGLEMTACSCYEIIKSTM